MSDRPISPDYFECRMCGERFQPGEVVILAEIDRMPTHVEHYGEATQAKAKRAGRLMFWQPNPSSVV